MSTTITSTASRPGAVLPQRQTATPQVAPRQPFRVLQTSRAPAQLSLFPRPGSTVTR